MREALKHLAVLAGLSALNTPFIGGSDIPQKVGYLKSQMHQKAYDKRKRRLKISGASRNINHRLNK